MSSDIDRGSVLGKRRFLLVVSFVLAVFHYYGASLSDEIKTPIIELNYTPPRLDIGVVLWVSWIWGLLRYYQYETTFKNEALDKYHIDATEQLCVKALSRQLQQKVTAGLYEPLIPADAKVDVPPTKSGYYPLNDGGKWIFQNPTVRVLGPDGSFTPVELRDGLSFSPLETKKLQARIWRTVLREHPSFVDFKLTYVLCLIAPSAAIIDALRYFS